MLTGLDQIEAQALGLPDRERAELAERINSQGLHWPSFNLFSLFNPFN